MGRAEEKEREREREREKERERERAVKATPGAMSTPKCKPSGGGWTTCLDPRAFTLIHACAVCTQNAPTHGTPVTYISSVHRPRSRNSRSVTKSELRSLDLGAGGG